MFDSLLPLLQVANTTVPIETVTGLAQQVGSGSDPTATALSITSLATGIGAAVKSVFTDKHQKTSEQEIDFDQEEFRRLVKIENDYTIQNPAKTRAEILAMSAYPDEPAIKTSLAEAYAKDYVEYKQYNTKKYYQKK